MLLLPLDFSRDKDLRQEAQLSTARTSPTQLAPRSSRDDCARFTCGRGSGWRLPRAQLARTHKPRWWSAGTNSHRDSCRMQRMMLMMTTKGKAERGFGRLGSVSSRASRRRLVISRSSSPRNFKPVRACYFRCLSQALFFGVSGAEPSLGEARETQPVGRALTNSVASPSPLFLGPIHSACVS